MAAIDDLRNLLKQDIQQLDQLNELLAREQELLRSGEATALEGLTREKNQALNAIRDRARQKIHTLVAMGYQPNSGQPSHFLRAAGDQALNELWLEAESRLKRCHERNQVNGRIIGHLQRRLGKLTDIIRGASDQAKLYGDSGQQTSVNHTNILASA